MTASSLALSRPRERASRLGPMRKLSRVAWVSFRQSLGDRATLGGRVAFYFLLLMVFTELWQAVLSVDEGSGGAGSGAAHRDYVWYLAVTEWIMLSQPPLHAEIEADVRSGDVAYQLARPLPYFSTKLAQAAGELGLRLLVLAPAGLLFARGLSGGWPSQPLGLLWAVPLGLVASGLMLMFLCGVGLSAFALQDCFSVYLIYQKLAFLLGGLMLPLSIYPSWLRELALASPFAAMLYGPGRMVFAEGGSDPLAVLSELAVWIVAVGVLLVWGQRRALRALEINGG